MFGPAQNAANTFQVGFEATQSRPSKAARNHPKHQDLTKNNVGYEPNKWQQLCQLCPDDSGVV